jgi:hypothetical protein
MSGFSPCVISFQLFATTQRLKQESEVAAFGTTEVVPFQSIHLFCICDSTEVAPFETSTYSESTLVAPFRNIHLIKGSLTFRALRR